MINLLPPEIKEQSSYSKKNAKLIKYIWFFMLTAIISGGLLGYSYYSVQTKLNSTNKELADRQKQIDQYKDIEAKAKEINSRISAIKSISASQSHFSSLLDDLAKFTPKTIIITSITLTGDDKKPVRISASGDSYASIASFRDALEIVPRLSGADIESISYNDTDKNYTTSITIGFKPGQAK